MAIRAVIQMRRGWNTIQLVLMTACTVRGTISRYQTGVVRPWGMEYAPIGAVTGRTVTARREGSSIGA